MKGDVYSTNRWRKINLALSALGILVLLLVAGYQAATGINFNWPLVAGLILVIGLGSMREVSTQQLMSVRVRKGLGVLGYIVAFFLIVAGLRGVS